MPYPYRECARCGVQLHVGGRSLCDGCLDEDRARTDDQESEVTTFKIGDVVTLKAGGPRLTIKDVGGDRAVCVWFSREDVLQEDTFRTACLVLARPGGEADFAAEARARGIVV